MENKTTERPIEEDLIERLAKQRVHLDKLLGGIAQLPKSRGASLSYTALQKGRMYLGEICRELGHAYPYEATKKATDASGIQPATDLSLEKMVLDSTETVALNNLRHNLEQEIKDLELTITTIRHPKDSMFKMSCVCSEAWRGLKEARMWLGIRLGELHDKARGKR